MSARAASSTRRDERAIAAARPSAAELRQQRAGDGAIEVVAAERRVAARRLDLEHAVLELEDRDVERAAAQVEDGEGPLGLPCRARRRARPPSAR